jgi:hypothetical protein
MTRVVRGRGLFLLGLALAIPVGCSSVSKDENGDEPDASWTCFEGAGVCRCLAADGDVGSSEPRVKACTYSTCFRYTVADTEACDCGSTGYTVDTIDARDVRAVAACPPGRGRGPDPGDGGTGGVGGTGTAGKGGGGDATGGTVITGGTGTAGKAGGGTSGVGGTGTTGGTGTEGGVGGTGTAGSGTAGGSDMGPFTCPGVAANCNHFASFPISTAQCFGTGDFTGGISVFGAGITRDPNDLAHIHITGMVTGYGHGFNVWFTSCSDLSAYTGVSFIMTGTAGPQDLYDFQVQTNSTYPWQPRPADLKGSCTAPSGMDPFGYCIPPTIAITTGPEAAVVLWSNFVGGMPVSWSSTTSPREIVGLQWQFRWSTGSTPYAVDISLSNVSFISDASPRAECVPVAL